MNWIHLWEWMLYSRLINSRNVENHGGRFLFRRKKSKKLRCSFLAEDVEEIRSENLCVAVMGNQREMCASRLYRLSDSIMRSERLRSVERIPFSPGLAKFHNFWIKFVSGAKAIFSKKKKNWSFPSKRLL